MIRARVVLPTPGGPHKMNEETFPESIMRRKIQSFPTKWDCPMYSSIVFGLSRSASGAYIFSYFFTIAKVTNKLERSIK